MTGDELRICTGGYDSSDVFHKTTYRFGLKKSNILVATKAASFSISRLHQQYCVLLTISSLFLTIQFL